MNFITRYLAKRIVIDVSPSKFVFSRLDNDFRLSMETFIWLVDDGKNWAPLAIGKEIDEKHRLPNIHRFEIFEAKKNTKPATQVDNDALFQLILEYGIGKSLEREIIPPTRPIVFILGVNRFYEYFSEPQSKFEEMVKRAGAATVIFDRTSIEN